MNEPIKKKRYYKSFALKDIDWEQLDYLCKTFGLNASAVIRKLLTEAFLTRKNEEKQK